MNGIFKQWQKILLLFGILAMLLGFQNQFPNRVQAETKLLQTNIQLVEVADGFERGTSIVHAGDGSGRLFIPEQLGSIKIVQNGEVIDEPFIDLAEQITMPESIRQFWAQGVLSLAFHPNFEENGRLFINYTDEDQQTVISEFMVSPDNPNQAELESELILLTIEQPFDNHNGGDIVFGPDGYLYIALGDGGWQVGATPGDPFDNAQNPDTLLGSILRLDMDHLVDGLGYGYPTDNPFVESSEGLPEVWSWGLRYPWRFSFDRETGDLYITDVGHYDREEINFLLSGSNGGNFGWPAFEGSEPFAERNPPATYQGDYLEGTIMPILEYSHGTGDCSVTGGYVYRGESIPELEGYYVYGDFCSTKIWIAHPNEDGEWESELLMRTNFPISAFGEDDDGELYVLEYNAVNGSLYRFEMN